MGIIVEQGRVTMDDDLLDTINLENEKQSALDQVMSELNQHLPKKKICELEDAILQNYNAGIDLAFEHGFNECKKMFTK